MKPLPGQKELPLVIDRTIDQIQKLNNEYYKEDVVAMGIHERAGKGVDLARLFIKYDDKPTSEMWIEILRLSRELVK